MPEEPEDMDWHDQSFEFVDPGHGLWPMIVSPLVAAIHFTVTYIGTSVYCIAREPVGLSPMANWLGWFTLAAVAFIMFCSWVAWRRLRLAEKAPNGRSKRRQEIEFLARIMFYLANLSWVGVLFVASPLLFFGRCT